MADFTPIPKVTAAVERNLHAAGFYDYHDLYNAPDQELLEVSGIGPAMLQRIRGFLGQE